MNPSKGLHHITAVSGDPQTNVDFYQQVLGQRLIKTTVNFDDPGTYHLYYGDEIGSLGTALTFFPWQNMPRGRVGNGETGALAYAIRPEALGFWERHLAQKGIEYTRKERFSAPMLALLDPDGMAIELIASEHHAQIQHWQAGPISAENALRGFHSVTLWLVEVEGTADILSEQLGYRFINQEGQRYRFQAQNTNADLYVDILHRPGAPRAQFGVGSIHHIAFRTRDDAEQLAYRQNLLQAGQRVTPVQDRQYFHSIYFRAPGGVLFEIATDEPGFLIDESVEELGSSLRLPPWYEAQRAAIEAILPPLERRVLAAAD